VVITTEYVARWLKNAGHEGWFFYVAGAALISLLVYLFVGESSSRSNLERETGELRADDLEPANTEPAASIPNGSLPEDDGERRAIGGRDLATTGGSRRSRRMTEGEK
jgi:hypothetical protein